MAASILAQSASAPVPIEALEDQITELAAHIHAATYRLLCLIAELDRRAPYGAWGMKSCAHWLNWKCGIGLVAAREKVRVARALEGLPQICTAFEKGEVSYSKVRAMTRIATPDNEDYLLMIARHGTAHHVEELVRKYRRMERAEAAQEAMRQHEARYLTYYHDDDGSLVFKGRLPPEQGLLVLKALEAASEHLRDEQKNDSAESPGGTAREDRTENVSAESSRPLAQRNDSAESYWVDIRAGDSFVSRRADALVTMAETFLTKGPGVLVGGEKHQIVVHVEGQVLKQDDGMGRAEFEDGPYLGPDTARRLSCDASLVRMIDDAQGEPLSVGRKSRSIPPALRRALNARDKGCRFPGCCQRSFVDGHHIHHWADGGETSLGNLVLLCRRHHRLVHEGGFDVHVDTGGKLFFTRPDGVRVPEAPPAPRAIETLEAKNRRADLAIDAETCRSKWDGLPMDYHMAVDAILACDARRGSDQTRS